MSLKNYLLKLEKLKLDSLIRLIATKYLVCKAKFQKVAGLFKFWYSGPQIYWLCNRKWINKHKRSSNTVKDVCELYKSTFVDTFFSLYKQKTLSFMKQRKSI